MQGMRHLPQVDGLVKVLWRNGATAVSNAHELGGEMIYASLNHLVNGLNQHLRRVHGMGEDMAVLSPLVGIDGAPAARAEGRLSLSLVNVERETAAHQRKDGVTSLGSVRGTSAPPLHLNLHVLLAANPGGGNYGDFLRHLSSGIGFFQRHPLFDRGNSPDMDPRLEQLVLEPENLRISELSNLWGILGGKYLPSMLYKVRMVTFASDDPMALVPGISRPATGVGAG